MITSKQIIDDPTGEITWTDDNGVKHWALFKEHTDTWGVIRNLPYAILFTNTQEIRYARVLKTVVHVAIDEADDGKAILTSWKVKAKFY